MAVWATVKTKVADNYSSLKEPTPVRLLEAPAKSPAKEDAAQGLMWGGWREEEAAALVGSACAVCLQFKCCGSNNYTDWADSVWIRSSEASGRKVPDSCCKTITDLCGRRDHPSNIYKEVKIKGGFRASCHKVHEGGGLEVRVLG